MPRSKTQSAMSKENETLKARVQELEGVIQQAQVIVSALKNQRNGALDALADAQTSVAIMQAQLRAANTQGADTVQVDPPKE